MSASLFSQSSEDGLNASSVSPSKNTAVTTNLDFFDLEPARLLPTRQTSLSKATDVHCHTSGLGSGAGSDGRITQESRQRALNAAAGRAIIGTLTAAVEERIKTDDPSYDWRQDPLGKLIISQIAREENWVDQLRLPRASSSFGMRSIILPTSVAIGPNQVSVLLEPWPVGTAVEHWLRKDDPDESHIEPNRILINGRRSLNTDNYGDWTTTTGIDVGSTQMLTAKNQAFWGV